MIHNLSKEELGRRVGVQRAAIQKYEKGTVENIPLKTIEKIANVFGVSPSYLVGWSQIEPTPLSAEVKLLGGLKRFYGDSVVDLVEIYTKLNAKGQKRVCQYVTDMEQIYSQE